MGSRLGVYRDREILLFILLKHMALIVAPSLSEGVACRQPPGNAHENNGGECVYLESDLEKHNSWFLLC